MWVPSNHGNYDSSDSSNLDDTRPSTGRFVAGKESKEGDKRRGEYVTRDKISNIYYDNRNNGYHDNDKNEYQRYLKSNNYYNYNYYNNVEPIARRDIERNKKTPKHNKQTNQQKVTFTSAVSDDINLIWKSFSKYGHLRNVELKEYGFYGSGVSKMSLGPGEEGTISLVMSWYYPYRDHAGEYVGQYYR